LTGGVSTLLEWDAKIPPFPVLHAEVLKARQHIGDELADPAMVGTVLLEEAGFNDSIPEPRFSSARCAVPHPLHHIAANVQ